MVAAVHVLISHPVASNDLSWLRVEVRRDGLGELAFLAQVICPTAGRITLRGNRCGAGFQPSRSQQQANPNGLNR